jgi:hypothetical protein
MSVKEWEPAVKLLVSLQPEVWRVQLRQLVKVTGWGRRCDCTSVKQKEPAVWRAKEEGRWSRRGKRSGSRERGKVRARVHW